MTAVELGQIVGVAAALLAVVQILRSLYRSLRERDEALVIWGKEVITFMAHLEELFAPHLSEGERQKIAFGQSLRAGVLLDHGRLFFQNVGSRQDSRGYRVKILDQLVKVSYIANRIASSSVKVDDDLRLKLWDCRKRFVALLQDEMRWSLKRRSKAEIGDSIPTDPTSWSTPPYRGWWQI